MEIISKQTDRHTQRKIPGTIIRVTKDALEPKTELLTRRMKNGWTNARADGRVLDIAISTTISLYLAYYIHGTFTFASSCPAPARQLSATPVSVWLAINKASSSHSHAWCHAYRSPRTQHGAASRVM